MIALTVYRQFIEWDGGYIGASRLTGGTYGRRQRNLRGWDPDLHPHLTGPVLLGQARVGYLRRTLGPHHTEPGPEPARRRLDPPELAEKIEEGQAFHDRPSVGADLPELGLRPLFQQDLHLLAGEFFAEPGGALAGQRFGEVFASGERVERGEQRGLGVCDGLGHGRDPHSTLPERLEPEPKGLQLYLE